MHKKPKYSFNSGTQSQLKGFGPYLQGIGNGESSIRKKTNYAGCFLKWLENERLRAEETKYNDMLVFIDHCRLEGKSTKHVNTILLAIRNYYSFLKCENENITNPANGLTLKGQRHKIPSGILPIGTLENLYKDYPTKTTREKRNKIILGLLVYQAVTTEELHKLEPANINLKEGKIYIPGGRKRNSRTLELKPFQILELHGYLNETRPKIIEETNKPRPARKPEQINDKRINDQLFISTNGSENLKNSLLHMFKAVQKTNIEIKNAKQIRASTITDWLKHHNLRQVQYFAGHRYVSSTERYQVNNLENLQKQLEKYHPLNNQ